MPTRPPASGTIAPAPPDAHRGVPASIVIVGAGIGGLTAALTLSARGHAVTLIERRTGFSEAGAGLQLSPNASRVLMRLGLGPEIRRAAGEPRRVAVRSMASGRLVGEIALGPVMRERYGAPYLVIHRADLQTILLDAVRSQANVRLLVGRRATAVETGAGASVRCETANGGAETLPADLVIGADGLWSQTRRALGDARAPRFRGLAAWRATLPREDLPAEIGGDETGPWLGRGTHVVHYPVSGGRLLNLIVIRPEAAPREGWNAPGEAADVLKAFAGAPAPLRDLVARAPRWGVWSLFDLPAGRLAAGRVALLGDAAHPVLPFLAQGAALAIEDAAVLAALLEGEDHAAALRRYAADRRPRVRRVQGQARRNARFYHAGPLLSRARDLVLRRRGPMGMAEAYAWLYGWTPG